MSLNLEFLSYFIPPNCSALSSTPTKYRIKRLSKIWVWEDYHSNKGFVQPWSFLLLPCPGLTPNGLFDSYFHVYIGLSIQQYSLILSPDSCMTQALTMIILCGYLLSLK